MVKLAATIGLETIRCPEADDVPRGYDFEEARPAWEQILEDSWDEFRSVEIAIEADHLRIMKRRDARDYWAAWWKGQREGRSK